MSVKIRLARRGRKKLSRYDVVVADARAPRDGRFIEKIGIYDPNSDPATIEINDQKAFEWVMKGAQPTDTVRAMLSYRGVMLKKHLQMGVLKGAITQEAADKKYDQWLNEKDTKIQGKVDRLATAKVDNRKAKLEAETKVKEARAEAIKQKKIVAETVLVEEIKEASAVKDEALAEDVAEVEATQAEVAVAPVVEETPAVEETPIEEPQAEVAEDKPATEAPAEEEAKGE